jgi:hypothetical protein
LVFKYDARCAITDGLNSLQEHRNTIIISPYFTKDITQIYFQNTIYVERISSLYELGLNNRSKVIDNIFAIQDRVTALESQVAVNTQGLSYIKTAYDFSDDRNLIKIGSI